MSLAGMTGLQHFASSRQVRALHCPLPNITRTHGKIWPVVYKWKRCLPNALYAGQQIGKVLVHVACDVPISAVPQVYFRYGPDSLQLWCTSCSSFLNLGW